MSSLVVIDGITARLRGFFGGVHGANPAAFRDLLEVRVAPKSSLRCKAHVRLWLHSRGFANRLRHSFGF